MALAWLLATAAPAASDGIRVPGGGNTPNRPEIRSYQPYSGLQRGFRPEPPVERDEPGRPRVVMPEPVAPLIESGPQKPHSAQYYRYCPTTRRCL